MANKPVLLLLGIDCPAAIEAKYNKWYDEVHIPMLTKFKGVKRVRRGKMPKEEPGMAPYLTMYEFDSMADYEGYMKSPERTAAVKDMEETFKDVKFTIKWRVIYDVIKDTKK
ncbi:MAG: EthD family reductase [Dehalococcoidales bacterium]|nr:EthD family reductase [Dehalococcoidales bacterium]